MLWLHLSCLVRGRVRVESERRGGQNALALSRVGQWPAVAELLRSAMGLGPEDADNDTPRQRRYQELKAQALGRLCEDQLSHLRADAADDAKLPGAGGSSTAGRVSQAAHLDLSVIRSLVEVQAEDEARRALLEEETAAAASAASARRPSEEISRPEGPQSPPAPT